MKKIITVVLAVVFALSSTACGSINSIKPENTIQEFCEALKLSDGNRMSSLCTENLRPNDIYESIESSFPYLAEYIKENSQKTGYEICSVDVKGKKATIDVRFSYINGDAVIRDAFSKAFQNLIGMMLIGTIDENDIDNTFNLSMAVAINAVEEKSVETKKESEVQFELTKTDRNWLISNVDDEFLAVISCNTFSTLEDIGKFFDNQSNTSNTSSIQNVYLASRGGNAYSVIYDSSEADKTLVWSADEESWYDAESDCWIWYNTEVTPCVWQYWVDGISSDYGDYGWMEHDDDGWWIEADFGKWIALPDRYETSHLWYIVN